MPIWLRNFTFNQIAEYKQQEKDAHNKASSKGKKGTNIDLNNPGKVPDSPHQINPPSYITKASKK
tara:strand:+ start:117 stop:311 length:195 start_codon:yes stop_codon:yes gene_type:complete